MTAYQWVWAAILLLLIYNIYCNTVTARALYRLEFGYECLKQKLVKSTSQEQTQEFPLYLYDANLKSLRESTEDERETLAKIHGGFHKGNGYLDGSKRSSSN